MVAAKFMLPKVTCHMVDTVFMVDMVGMVDVLGVISHAVEA